MTKNKLNNKSERNRSDFFVTEHYSLNSFSKSVYGTSKSYLH